MPPDQGKPFIGLVCDLLQVFAKFGVDQVIGLCHFQALLDNALGARPTYLVVNLICAFQLLGALDELQKPGEDECVFDALSSASCLAGT
jgi:hypothetical protein